MKALYELNRYVDPDAVRFRLSRRRRENSASLLYELLQKPGLGDEEARDLVFPEEKESARVKFAGVKTRLRRMMINSVLLDVDGRNDFSSYESAYATGFRMLTITRILVARRAYRQARQVAFSAFHSLRDYDIIPLLQQLAEVLSALHLGVGYKEKLFVQYDKLHQDYSRALYDLSQVQTRFRNVRHMVYAQRYPAVDIGRAAQRYWEELEDVQNRYPSNPQIQSLINQLETIAHINLGQYAEAIAASRRGEAVLRSCHAVSQVVLHNNQLTRLECILRLRDYRSGMDELAAAREHMKRDSINGIKLQEYAIRFGLITRHYDEAYTTLAAVDRKSLQRHMTVRHQEFWLILEAYVNLLVKVGRIGKAALQQKIPRFKVSRFFNEVPSFSRDKRGVNVQILIIHVLHFIVEHKFSKVIDRAEALDRYSGRYLQNEENIRDSCFFRIIGIAVETNFLRQATELKAAPVYAKMKQKSSVMAARASETELVPYEELYDILIANLRTKPGRSRRARK